MNYGFGIDVGGTTVKMAYFQQDGTMLDKWEIPTDTSDGGKNILPDIARAVQDYVAGHGIDPQQLLGIGLGVPGPVSQDGIVNRCINLGWGVFNVEQELGALTGLKVQAGNDATVAALGECWMGSGKGSRDMIFVTLGTGVGGGIIVGGNVIYGAHGSGAEIGHMTLCREEEEMCSCGKRGCVEQYISATGVVRLARRAMAGCDTPSVLRQTEQLTAKDVFDAGKDGDALALEVLDQVYRFLGEFLGNLCNVTNPEVVVLGGGVCRAGQPLLEGAQRYFREHVFHAAANVRFALASLGNDAGAYGAFKLLLD